MVKKENSKKKMKEFFYCAFKLYLPFSLIYFLKPNNGRKLFYNFPFFEYFLFDMFWLTLAKFEWISRGCCSSKRWS